MKQNTINHIALVLDASGSMHSLAKELIKVVDGQISELAQLSQQLNQETRITVYTFNDRVECIFYDIDVLRLPSLADDYKAIGQTALIDATLKSQKDLAATATLYGDHAFLTYVLTDGAENASRGSAASLRDTLKTLPHNWTVACLVPDAPAKFRAQAYGFSPDNVAIWNATSAAGVTEVGETIRQATANYMTARSTGTFSGGTKTLFSMDAATLNHRTVSALKELTGFRVEPVKQPAAIKPFIDSLGLPFISGNYFFPLIKRERVSDAKQVLVRHKISGKIFGGPEVRRMLGLPDTGEVRISPQPNAEYDVFVQSTSLNRNLIPGHDLLIKV